MQTPVVSLKVIPSKADLVADFVDPSDLELVISNTSEVTAMQPTFQTYLVNLEAPNLTLLPIGRQTGDFLKGHASLLRIPVLHYGNTAALNGLKSGDRLCGWIALSCANCAKVRYFCVYYRYLRGGWYAESAKEPSLTLPNFKQLAKQTSIPQSVVKNSVRKGILDRHGKVRFPQQGTLR